MAIFVGIDEAGFGPIIGPLVVSSCAFVVPGRLVTEDFWHVLNKSVGKTRRRLGGRLLIADSKKAYSKSLGIKHLQRTVLASLRCLAKTPATLGDLLKELSPGLLERLDAYPWYKDIGGCLLSIDARDTAIASRVLAEDLAANGMEVLQITSHCLDVAYYNEMVSTVRNKARVLFTATATLVKEALDMVSDGPVQIVIDRQGGRVHYRGILQVMFPDMDLTILRESPASSDYELSAGGNRVRLHFVVGADGRFLPVSLASMVSKYLRELLVGCINRYFAGFGTALKPTAGYWTDGLRFIEDIRTHLPDLPLDGHRLIRSR